MADDQVLFEPGRNFEKNLTGMHLKIHFLCNFLLGIEDYLS